MGDNGQRRDNHGRRRRPEPERGGAHRRRGGDRGTEQGAAPCHDASILGLLLVPRPPSILGLMPRRRRACRGRLLSWPPSPRDATQSPRDAARSANSPPRRACATRSPPRHHVCRGTCAATCSPPRHARRHDAARSPHVETRVPGCLEERIDVAETHIHWILISPLPF